MNLGKYGLVVLIRIATSPLVAWRNLKAAIRESKRRRWTELCSQVEEEPYSRPYKIVMKKVGGSSNNRAYGAGSCVKNHGPAVPAAPSSGGHTPGKQGGATTVDGGRDRRGVDRVRAKTKKALGPDGIPTVCGPSYIGPIQGYSMRCST